MWFSYHLHSSIPALVLYTCIYHFIDFLYHFLHHYSILLVLLMFCITVNTITIYIHRINVMYHCLHLYSMYSSYWYPVSMVCLFTLILYKITPLLVGFVLLDLYFMFNICRSLFVLLSFALSFCCFFLFDLRLLITSFVSSNPSRSHSYNRNGIGGVMASVRAVSA